MNAGAAECLEMGGDWKRHAKRARRRNAIFAQGVLMISGARNNPKKDVVEEVHLCGEMGFDFFELTVEAPCASPGKLLAKNKEMHDALSSYNFGVLSHYPWYFSVAHPYDSVQKAIEREFGLAFEAASLFGAKLATIHTEWMPPSVQERGVRVAKTSESVKRLSKLALEHGLQLLVENFGASSFSIKDFEGLFSEVDVGMTFDVGHAAKSDGEGVPSYIKHFRKRIRHVHLHDNNKREDQHLPLGAGKIGIPSVVKELKGFYDGTITLEIHSEDRDYLKMSREKLEMLWYGKKKFEENKEYLYPEKT